MPSVVGTESLHVSYEDPSRAEGKYALVLICPADTVQ